MNRAGRARTPASRITRPFAGAVRPRPRFRPALSNWEIIHARRPTGGERARASARRPAPSRILSDCRYPGRPPEACRVVGRCNRSAIGPRKARPLPCCPKFQVRRRICLKVLKSKSATGRPVTTQDLATCLLALADAETTTLPRRYRRPKARKSRKCSAQRRSNSASTRRFSAAGTPRRGCPPSTTPTPMEGVSTVRRAARRIVFPRGYRCGAQAPITVYERRTNTSPRGLSALLPSRTRRWYGRSCPRCGDSSRRSDRGRE